MLPLTRLLASFEHDVVNEKILRRSTTLGAHELLNIHGGVGLNPVPVCLFPRLKRFQFRWPMMAKSPV